MNKQLCAILFALFTTITVIGQQADELYFPGKLYVRFKPTENKEISSVINETKGNFSGIFAEAVQEAFDIIQVKKAFAEKASAKLNATVIVEFGNEGATADLIARLKKDPRIEMVERIPIDRITVNPNDPSLSSQWHLSKINAPAAWDYFSTGSTAVVAIVDDAVERTHADLQPNIWLNTKEIFGNGLDDDGNGYVDDINGWDIADNDNNPEPPTAEYSHGTHVAGIVSAATNNAIGISSIGFSCKLMCVKASGSNPNSISHGYQGIIYAANNGANIINCSWGSSVPSSTGQEVIDYAISKGAIVVVAAGNDNSNNLFYPAAFTGVVSVASTDINDLKSGFSNYGSWVKISAPGSSILSTVPYGGYGNKSGTSMASPLVAGLLGLMKSANPGMPNADLLNCLYNTATNISMQNPLYPGMLGAGRINAEAAMACVAASLNRAPTASFSGTPLTIVQGGKVTFTDKSIYNPTSWTWNFTGGTPSTFNGKTPPEITYNTPGSYPVTLTVSNAFGSDDSTIQNMVVVNEPPSCVSINYPIPAGWTPLTYLAPPGGTTGYRNGVNANKDKQKAMFFDVSATNLMGITKILVLFTNVDAGNGNKKIRFRIYDGTGGTPGTELGVVEKSKSELRADWLASRFTTVDLPKNIDLPASKKFFVSVDISELVWKETENDSLSIRANSIGQSPGAPAWDQKADGSWVNSNISAWPPAGMSLFIHPYLTSKPAKSVISPLNPIACFGTPVTFDATGSSYSDLLKWEIPGATTGGIAENQMTITPQFATAGIYKVYLSTRGGCSELRTDSTTLTLNASPTLNITASKNPICLGETTTLTASGATTYSWSPATGLNGTVGAQVQANPAATTTYTISGTSSGCTAQVPFELKVIPRTTEVSLNASKVDISSATEVTFTAAGVNGGSAPNYNFLVNSISVQNGASSIMVRTVSPGDKVLCEFTSNEPCVDEKVATSNEIVMGNSLPVSLISFTAKTVGGGNLLEWATASEANTSLFEIEKSKDGANFQWLDKVQAAGNSTINKTYSYLDVKPLQGSNYYRLKMVDNDGSFRYSKIVLVTGGGQFSGISLYPNPTREGNNAKFNMAGLEKGPLQISILNINGRQLKSYSIFSTDGTIQVQIDTHGLAPGNYIIHCQNDKGELIKSLHWQVNK